MKKNLNIIQIKGFRGILYIAFIGLCLAAGFGWFPSWLCMHIWNYIASFTSQVPAIGIFQGILLWGILVASYFTFRKEKLVVCMKTSDELTEEELKAVFADMKRQVQDDAFLRNMLKARETEIKIKNLAESNIPGISITEVKNMQLKTTNNEKNENVQTK